MAKEILRVLRDCDALIRRVNRQGGWGNHTKPPVTPETNPVEKFEFSGFKARYQRPAKLTQVTAKLRNHWAVNEISYCADGPVGTVLYVHSPYYSLGDKRNPYPRSQMPVLKPKTQREYAEIDELSMRTAFQQQGYSVSNPKWENTNQTHFDWQGRTKT